MRHAAKCRGCVRLCPKVLASRPCAAAGIGLEAGAAVIFGRQKPCRRPAQRRSQRRAANRRIRSPSRKYLIRLAPGLSAPLLPAYHGLRSISFFWRFYTARCQARRLPYSSPPCAPVSWARIFARRQKQHLIMHRSRGIIVCWLIESMCCLRARRTATTSCLLAVAFPFSRPLLSGYDKRSHVGTAPSAFCSTAAFALLAPAQDNRCDAELSARPVRNDSGNCP